jgi:diguanylate cyclase (GGDEF)-like protein
MSKPTHRSIATLFQAAQSLATGGSLKDKLQTVSEQIVDALHAGWAGFVLIEASKQILSAIVLTGADAAGVQTPAFQQIIEATASVPPSLAENQQNFINSRALFDRLFSDGNPKGPHFSGLVEALTFQEQIMGLVVAARRLERPPFGEEDFQLLATIAHQVSLTIYNEQLAALEKKQRQQAAVAIENARLYSSAQNQVDQLDALQATIADISAELELPKLLEAILKRAVILLNSTGGDLGLYEEARNDIWIVASYNMGKDYRGTRMTAGEGAMGLALESRQPVIVEDYQTWRNASTQYPDFPWHPVLAVPFTFGSRLVGVIGVVDSDPQRRYTVPEQHLLSLFAQHAAIAVENARLYQSAREAADRRAILHQVSQEIVAASLDLEGIYAAIHNAAAQLMPAEAFTITQYNEKENTNYDAYLVDQDGRSDLRSFPGGTGLSGKVVSSGKTIYIEDLQKDPDRERYLHFGKTVHVRSVLAVPMRLRGKVIGMLSTQSYSPGAYTSEDQYLLEMLASYAAIAIDNARLFTHIQQLATTDPLTDISNRRYLFDLGRQEFLRSKRFNHALSVIMMDIDHFKLVNDRFGHAAGDRVLCQLAKMMRSEVREVDIVGRYGGEEFTLILPETPLGLAGEVAERLRQKINHTFYSTDQTTPQITVSIGVACLEADTPDFEALVDKSDMALYAAKEAGRNRVEIIQPDHTINMASPKE